MVLELYENGVHAGSDKTDDCAYGFTIEGARFCTASFSVNPLLGPTTDVLLKMGGRLSYLIVEQKEYWRLVAPVYLHAGLIHFLLNMLIFLQICVRLEWMHGCWRVGFVYLVSGIFGVIMGAVFSGNTIGVGASGAIFGLIGASIGDLIQNWGLYKRPCSNMVSLLFVSVLQLLLGTIPMLDNFAHFFGFLMGLISSLTVFILQRVDRSGQRLDVKCHQRLIQVIAAMVIPFLFVASVIVLLAGTGDDICPHCQKISCIPFPWGCDTGACWWDCSAASVDPRCSASISYWGEQSNATVIIHCPIRNAVQNITRHPVDVTSFNQNNVHAFCRDFCPDNW